MSLGADDDPELQAAIAASLVEAQERSGAAAMPTPAPGPALPPPDDGMYVIIPPQGAVQHVPAAHALDVPMYATRRPKPFWQDRGWRASVRREPRCDGLSVCAAFVELFRLIIMSAVMFANAIFVLPLSLLLTLLFNLAADLVLLPTGVGVIIYTVLASPRLGPNLKCLGTVVVPIFCGLCFLFHIVGMAVWTPLVAILFSGVAVFGDLPLVLAPFVANYHLFCGNLDKSRSPYIKWKEHAAFHGIGIYETLRSWQRELMTPLRPHESVAEVNLLRVFIGMLAATLGTVLGSVYGTLLFAVLSVPVALRTWYHWFHLLPDLLRGGAPTIILVGPFWLAATPLAGPGGVLGAACYAIGAGAFSGVMAGGSIAFGRGVYSKVWDDWYGSLGKVTKQLAKYVWNSDF